MSITFKTIGSLFLAFIIPLFSCSAQAGKYPYQPISPSVRNDDRARVVLDDRHLKEGFSYIFENAIIYTPMYTTYVVGQHCYRGKPIRFDIPREKFTFILDNEEYHPPWGGGRSVWHRFHTDSRLNFLLIWLGLGYSVVELNQSACADVVLDTRYHLGDMLKKVKRTNIPILVHDNSGKKVGQFTLKVIK